jgi:hypothetical protein
LLNIDSHTLTVFIVGVSFTAIVLFVAFNITANVKNNIFEEARQVYEIFSHRVHKYFGVTSRFDITTMQGEAACLLIRVHNHPTKKNLDDLKYFCKDNLDRLEDLWKEKNQ